MPQDRPSFILTAPAALYVLLWLWLSLFDSALFLRVGLDLTLALGGVAFALSLLKNRQGKPGLDIRMALILIVLWAPGRVGAILDVPLWPCDILWIAGLLFLFLKNRRFSFDGVLFWFLLLVASSGAGLFGYEKAESPGVATLAPILAFFGLTQLLLSRSAAPIINRILQTDQNGAPYRPHPGRVNVAAGATLIAWVGCFIHVSPPVAGYLLIAAGAAFMDRLAEALIGKEAIRVEIMALFAPGLLAGIALIATGLSCLGTWTPHAAMPALALAISLCPAAFCLFLLFAGQTPPRFFRPAFLTLFPAAALLAAAIISAPNRPDFALAGVLCQSASFALWLIPSLSFNRISFRRSVS